MSTLRVYNIENPSTAAGGIGIATDGSVTVGGLQYPTAGPLSNRNLIINGAMQVAQRGTGDTGVTAGPSWAADRFRLNVNTCGTWTTANTTSNLPSGFSNSIKVDCTTAKVSLTGTDNCFLSQYVEAQNLVHLDYGSSTAKQITLSFWVKSNKTGDYVVELDHGDAATFNGIKYTINSANTWEYKTLTYVGDTSNAINNDNGVGLYVQWCLAAGPTLSSGTFQSNTWQTTTANRFAGQTNLADSTDNEWSITGIQLEVGERATPFEHRSYGDELASCQRYFYTHLGTDSTADGIGAGAVWQSNQIYVAIHHPVTMRSTPVFSNNISASTPGFIRMFAAGVASWNQTGSTFGTQRCGTNCSIVYLSDFYSNSNGTGGSVVTYTAGDAGWLEVFNDDLRMDFDAEL